MPNRIKGLDGGSIGPGSSNPVEQVRVSTPVTPAGTESSAGTGTDSVHITDTARALVALSQAVHETPDIDAGRVAAVQQAIDSGQYTVSPERIANRLMQLEHDLGSAAAR